MRTVYLVSFVLAVAVAAPTKDQSLGTYVPSPAPFSYGASAGSGSQIPLAASPPRDTFYFEPSSYLTSSLDYRTNNHLLEGFMPTGYERTVRSYSPYGPAVGASSGGASQAVAAGPAYGLFPNANIGGCAVPVLISCTPSISKGQIVKSQHGSYSAPHYAYRNVDFNTLMRMNEEPMQKAAEEQAQWSGMERADQATGKGGHQPTSEGHPNQLTIANSQHSQLQH